MLSKVIHLLASIIKLPSGRTGRKRAKAVLQILFLFVRSYFVISSKCLPSFYFFVLIVFGLAYLILRHGCFPGNSV